MNLISLDKVSFRYPGSNKLTLSEVSLDIPQGSFFALLGPNGAGKTTLMRLLCGRFPSFEGSLDIADDFRCESGFLNPGKVGVLLENPGIYPKLSIREYVTYFAGFYKSSESNPINLKEFENRLQHLAQALELPDLSTRMSQLSLGNRQKVQLLRAMVPNPRLLILDEPVANLDPMSRETVWRLISDWRKQEGGTAIVCSHILAEMEREATDFAIVNHGKILKAGSVSTNSILDDDSFPTLKRKSFNLEFEQDVSILQIQEALKAAGLPKVSINYKETGLTEIYRKEING